MSTSTLQSQDQPAPEGGSQDEESVHDRKRRRKVLSCLTCRRRKLKCGREYPVCIRCRNSACADSCTYEVSPASRGLTGKDSHLAEEYQSSLPKATGSASFQGRAYRPLSDDRPHSKATIKETIADSINSRLRRLEEVSGLVGEEPGVLEKSSPFAKNVLLRGKALKTRYYGASSPANILGHFPELRSFMKERIMQDPKIMDVHRDMRVLCTKAKRGKPVQHERQPTRASWFAMLPPTAALDDLVDDYFENMEITYRILHGPTFYEDYEAFQTNSDNSEISFLVILLLVVSIASSFPVKQPARFFGKSSSTRERAIQLVEVCESWLDKQTQKHLTLGLLQIRCLIVVAKQINRIKKKRSWMVAGSLIRFGMSIGLHRDPRVLGDKASLFDQEMRRRLWATMVELELQASFDRGMPTSSVEVTGHCRPPANMDDKSLQALGTQIPGSKEQGQMTWTRTSYLQLSSSSVALRGILNNLINAPDDPLDYEEMLAYDGKIRHLLQSLPEWPVATPKYQYAWEGPKDREVTIDGSLDGNVSTMSKTIVQKQIAISKALLELQLTQYLIPLHSPFAQRVHEDPRYQYSVMVCYETSNKILDLHRSLMSAGTPALSLLRDDVIGPALTICLNIYLSMAIEDSKCLHSLAMSFLPDVHVALGLLEENEKRNNSGLQHLWGLSAADALVRTKLAGRLGIDPNQPVKDAVERAVGICSEIIESQEDTSWVVPSQTQSNKITFPGNKEPRIARDPPLTDFEKLSTWAFDDLWNLDFGDLPAF